ncbi:transporter [Klebsiella pneumoniae]|nr:transporter [Klebsiella pneumoniae]
MSTSVSTTQLNLRIISIVVFTCICYLSIGLPLAVLPGYIHYQLGYSTFVAGIVISLQYISTLISRPHAGRYTDIWGPKKVVSLGIVCCLLSGAFTLLAVVLQATPMLAIAALLAGRVFLGVGESFTATGATLWGIKTVGAIHTSRVISWNGVATYVAMAVGAPLGVTLNHYFGISGFATVVVLVAAIGLLFARTRQDVKVTAGARAPFHAVVRKIWPYGLGLAFGTVGFGVIATFITLYFAAHSWQGRRVYPFAVQRRLYLRSPGAGKYHYPLWRSPGLPGLLHHRKSRPAAYLAGAISMDGRRRRLSHRFGFLAGLSGFRS